MKKIIICLLAILTFTNSTIIYADMPEGSGIHSDTLAAESLKNNDKQCDEEKAFDCLQNYLNECGEQERISIETCETIYDVDLIPFGACFDLNIHEKERGYAIVLNIDGEYIVSEFCAEGESPYNEKPKGALSVYGGPLSYLFTETSNSPSELFRKDPAVFYDLRNGNGIDVTNNKHYVQLQRRSDNGVQSLNTYGAFYLDNLSLFTTQTQQPDEYGCIPASASMCLHYLDATGQIGASSNYSSTQNIYDYLRPRMVDYDLGYSTSGRVVSAISSFSNNYCERNFWTSAYDFQPDTYFETAAEEIDNNCPLIIVWYGSGGQTSNHATAMKGYSHQYSADYAIVVDPWYQTPQTKTLYWSTSTVFGYFLFYLGSWR